MADKKPICEEALKITNGFADGVATMGNLFTAGQTQLAGMAKYTTDFFIPYLLAVNYFQRVEQERLFSADPQDSADAYLGLLENNIELMTRSMDGSVRMMLMYLKNEANGFTEALKQCLFEFNSSKMKAFSARQADLMNLVVNEYPAAIAAIEPEYGFHFEQGHHPKVDETDRFILYRVTPSLPQVKTRQDAKPVLIIPPYVLGANILGFLPGEQRSYAHCFADQGYPTYIRILKPIDTTPAMQVMSGEDDARDTRQFCETIFKNHGKQVTLNGYCQGGYNALCSLLSGILDGLVDAFITCVSPMDGTRSQGLARFLARLPKRFNDLEYGTKVLPNNNLVADGQLMGWVYKLKSIEQEIPAAVFYRDLMMFARSRAGAQPVNKTAAALNYWLQNDRTDLPLGITEISFSAYNRPITSDGRLPVDLFGGKLELKRIQEKKVPC